MMLHLQVVSVFDVYVEVTVYTFSDDGLTIAPDHVFV